MSELPYEIPDRLVVLAQRSGRCPVCRTSILKGEAICKVAGAWVHEDCADDREPMEAAA